MVRRKNDVILIVGVLFAALLVWLGLLLFRNEGAYAVVSVDGHEVSRHALSENTEVRIGNGTYNLLIIQDGSARMQAADCPDGLCISQGKAAYNGQSIVCLPNKVIVEIIGGKDSGIDEVAR